MITKCKKCGCDALIKNGDWYECPMCGAMMFDVGSFMGDTQSPTKMLEMLDQGKTENSVSKSVDYGFDVSSISEKDASNFEVQDIGIQNPKKKKRTKKNKKQNNKVKTNPTDKDIAQENPSKLKEAVTFMTPIVIALVIAILLKIFIFANAVVPTGSMLNTIQEGDRIVASRLSYINEDPQRYDIIIFKYPDDEKQLYVKRIIGMPGETIQVKNGIVYITDKDGNTTQAKDDFITNCVPTGDFGPYTVPLGSYFVMGDNRNDSWDSRFWNNKTVKREKILGKVKFRYYPNPGKIE